MGYGEKFNMSCALYIIFWWMQDEHKRNWKRLDFYPFIHPLTKDKVLDQSKMKAFAYDKR